MATRMSATAFAPSQTTPSFPASIARQRPAVTPLSSTKLFANEGGSANEEMMELTIETITDENSQTLLHPHSSPSRPVLVDAFAPWCGPCKLLDKVLRKAQPNYLGKVDFCRWNVNDKENTVELKKLFLDSGYTLTKLPSVIVFREGKPVAVRAGFANAFQLDDFLEQTLPDVLERTFDEDGVKMIPLTPAMIAMEEEGERALGQVVGKANEDDCNDPVECYERLEQIVWENRTVVPAMDGIMLPARS